MEVRTGGRGEVAKGDAANVSLDDGCNADLRFIHRTGNRRQGGTSAWEDNVHIRGGAITTARIEVAPEHIVFTLMNGAQAMRTTADVIKAET